MISIYLDNRRFNLASRIDLDRDFRWVDPDKCLSWQIAESTMYLLDKLMREDLLKVSGIKVFDWAYPIDWARRMERERKHGFNKKPWPQLVWCYDPTPHAVMNGRRHSLMGYPVFDTDLIAKLGALLKWHYENGFYQLANKEEYK